MDWDFSDLGREDDDRLAALVGTSSLGVNKNAGSFSIDLKLGATEDFQDGSVEKLKEPKCSTSVSSPSASSKRTRAIIGTPNVSCLVEGCTADLSNCREYHRRHRVCEHHSKTPVVIVRGKEQRFCQQCSRFQSIEEFDEEKRSCRKRLDGHNRRRRKPQREPFYMGPRSFLSDHQGARLIHFSTPQSYTTSTAGVVPTWPTVAKQHQELHFTDQQIRIPNSSAYIYDGRDSRFPFSLANDPEKTSQAVPEVPICHRLDNDLGPGERGQCALSLLSTQPIQTSGTSLHHLVHQNVIHQNQQSTSAGLHFDGLDQYSRSRAIGGMPPVSASQANPDTLFCSELFQVASDDLLGNAASEVLPFSWKQ